MHSGYSLIIVLTLVSWCYKYIINPLTLETIMWKRFLSWYQAYAIYKANRIVEAELYRLTDRELQDMGIGRSQIKDVVWNR